MSEAPMSLGLGIFLASLVLSATALFISTKNSWNWKKIFLRGLVSIVALLAIFSGSAYLYWRHNNRPFQQTSFAGINLGDTKADVTFKKGKSKDSSEADKWFYDESNGDVTVVNFENDKVTYIITSSHADYSIPELQGVSAYTSYETLVEKFGEPSNVSSNAEKTSRMVSFSKYNLCFRLQKGRIREAGIFTGGKGIVFAEEAEPKFP